MIDRAETNDEQQVLHDSDYEMPKEVSQTGPLLKNEILELFQLVNKS